MFAALVNKYGLVPKSAYPESENSRNSDDFKQYLNSKLREFAAELRRRSVAGASEDELRALKDEYMGTVYRICAVALGEPPEKFDFFARTKDDNEDKKGSACKCKAEADADGKAESCKCGDSCKCEGKSDAKACKCDKDKSDKPKTGKDERPQIREIGITPLEFYKKYVPVDVNDFVTLANAPLKNRPFNQRYRIRFSANVAEAGDMEFVNVPLDVFKKAALDQLTAGHPIWFACDCTQFALRKDGFFDQSVVRVDQLFGTEFTGDKAHGLEYGDSPSNHAMTFTGVNLGEDGKPNRWKVENSWGKDAGKDGYYVMSDAWFDRYVTELIIRKEYLDDATRALLDHRTSRARSLAAPHPSLPLTYSAHWPRLKCSYVLPTSHRVSKTSEHFSYPQSYPHPQQARTTYPVFHGEQATATLRWRYEQRISHPPPGVFDDEPPGWTNNAAAPSAASTHAVKPEPYSPPRMATPTAPAMSETLTQRKREMLKRCTDAAQQLGKPVLFGMTTSLILQSVPLPKDCDLNATELHTVSDSHRTRIRAVVPPTTPHIWKPLSAAHNARINKHVHALNLVHTWAQLAAHMSSESLVILGDATLTAIARKPSLSGGRTADEIYQDFVRQVSELPKFNAKATCMIALEFIAPRVDSPMESETRITTTQYGLPRAVTNYTVPGATFSNGEPITLDLAWPEFRVAIEYDGDHHRTDKAQWRRDNDKRELLRHHHWIVLIATAANMADEPSQAELAYRAGRQLALRGAIFDFTLTATPLNELARRKRRKSTGAH